MRALVQSIREIVAEGPVALSSISRIQDAVKKAIPGLQSSEICRAELTPGRYLCYKDPDFGFVVMLLVWGRGDATPIHDHGTWGVECVLKNSLLVTAYDEDETNPHALGAQVCEAGSILYNLPPSRDVHKVQQHGDKGPALSLHIYGREMSGNRMFVPGEGFKACCLETRKLETKFNLTNFPRCGKSVASL